MKSIIKLIKRKKVSENTFIAQLSINDSTRQILIELTNFSGDTSERISLSFELAQEIGLINLDALTKYKELNQND